ncbi:MAG: pitrilysin family protein [Bacteroidota bacterium]|nr:pitrilysin family protein [Bacteroidota bacterium]
MKREGIPLVLSLILLPPLFAQEPDRGTPPPSGPLPMMKLPPIQRGRLSNGLPFLLMEKHDVPLVEIRMIIEAGTAAEEVGMFGVASLTAALLTEGAGKHDAQGLADALDFLGVRLSVSAGLHTTAVSLSTPLSKLDDALALFTDVIRRPLFDEKELERIRKDRLTALRQWHDEPRVIATILFNRLLYGETHPYGRIPTGMEKDLRSLTVPTIRSFYEEHYHAGTATLVVVGDVNPMEFLAKCESAFGDWEARPAQRVETAVRKTQQPTRITIVHKPTAVQSEIRIGYIGAERTSPDYAALLVLNTILGGSFASRLNQNLREKHGYTYGARSSFSFRRAAGPFLAATAVQTDVTDKAVRECINELESIRLPVSREELERAKRYIACTYIQNFETAGHTADELGELVEFLLPDDTFTSFIDRILAVTIEDVRQAAEKYFDTDHLEIVVVGDRNEIEPGLRSLRLGKIRILDSEDVLGKRPG